MRPTTFQPTTQTGGPPGSSFLDRLRAWAAERERGDVPGWVLITIMTAGLVAALWLVAEPLLTGLFSSAVSSVGG
jgi:hypothetical protein